MDTATELEQWLRNEANKLDKLAKSRRDGAILLNGLTDEDRKISHALAEQMMGRKLPKTSRKEEERNGRIEERIAIKQEQEAAMLLRFADFVAGRNNGNYSVVERQEAQ